MDHDPDELAFDDLYGSESYFRTCGRCGARTTPRWSESACLEEARRYGWRRVPNPTAPAPVAWTCAGPAPTRPVTGRPWPAWGY